MAEAKDRKYLLISGYCRMESNDRHIIDGIILIIFEYHRAAQWSNKYKGTKIQLSENDFKATCMGDQYAGHSVRADFCIERGDITSWELECMIIWDGCNFIGVVTSEVTDFSCNPADGMKNAYGIDDATGSKYFGIGYQASLKWTKPQFSLKEIFTIKVIADWKEKQCKLTFYYNGKKLNDDIDEYSMLLPEFDEDIVLYPCVTPYNNGAYCIIRYV